MADYEGEYDVILDLMSTMTEKEKQAAYWMIKNIGLLDRLCEVEKLSEEEIEAFKKKALENEDYIMLIMALYKQQKDRMDRESREQ